MRQYEREKDKTMQQTMMKLQTESLAVQEKSASQAAAFSKRRPATASV